MPATYYGPRFRDSLEMHRAYANKPGGYTFKFPSKMNVIEAATLKTKPVWPFLGMNPAVLETGSIDKVLFKKPSLHFDAHFECGNLDQAFQVREAEYDLYMRVDSNTRGHHQWFYFKVMNGNETGRYRFNIVNFTKNASLYHQGMRINVHSQLSPSSDNDGWSKGGENIVYKLSKISQARIVPG